MKNILKDWLLAYGKKNYAGRISIPVQQQQEALNNLFNLLSLTKDKLDTEMFNLLLPTIAHVLVPASVNEVKFFGNNHNLPKHILIAKLKKWCFFCAKMLTEYAQNFLNIPIDHQALYIALLKKRNISEANAANNINEEEVDEFLESSFKNVEQIDNIIAKTSGPPPCAIEKKTITNNSFIDKIFKNLKIDPEKIMFLDYNNLPEDYPQFEDLDEATLLYFELDHIKKENL